MLTADEAHDLQDLLQFLAFYIDMLEYDDPPPGENGSPLKYNKQKRKQLAKAALTQLSIKISSFTRRDAPWPGDETQTGSE
jgi:hypothetical protein